MNSISIVISDSLVSIRFAMQNTQPTYSRNNFFRFQLQLRLQLRLRLRFQLRGDKYLKNAGESEIF